MRVLVTCSAAALALVGAQLVGGQARDVRRAWPPTASVPYAPSPAAAPFISLGYREVAADLMWIRTLAYLGGTTDTSAGVRQLVEATIALDDHLRASYDLGALGIQTASRGVDNEAHRAAIGIFERGLKVFPEKWEYAVLAGQAWIVDLKPEDEAERRENTRRGIALFEKAVRMPGGMEKVAATIAYFQDKLGQHELAVEHLREMILIAQDDQARNTLLKQLAELEQRDEMELRVAMLSARQAFLDEWYAKRPAVPASMFLLLGKRRDPYLDRRALAVDRDLIGTNMPDELEPLYEGSEPPAPTPVVPPGESSDTHPRTTRKAN
jgi:hypothetical protein